MKRQELMVLLMVAEGRGDDLFQIFDRTLLKQWVLALLEKGMLVSTRANAEEVLNGTWIVTDKGHIYLHALDTVPLPQAAWSMCQITGE